MAWIIAILLVLVLVALGAIHDRLNELLIAIRHPNLQPWREHD